MSECLDLVVRKKEYIEKYYTPFRELVGLFVTDVFDIVHLKDDTYCTIQFSNGDVYYGRIPNVRLQNKEDLLKPVRGGTKIIVDAFSKEIMVHLVLGPFGVWFPTGDVDMD